MGICPGEGEYVNGEGGKGRREGGRGEGGINTSADKAEGLKC